MCIFFFSSKRRLSGWNPGDGGPAGGPPVFFFFFFFLFFFFFFLPVWPLEKIQFTKIQQHAKHQPMDIFSQIVNIHPLLFGYQLQTNQPPTFTQQLNLK
eukprot:TRINITY_DN17653_c3_g1_i1.p4 TRINITY_DN17653_c3_g1~~TRINITY_DN17653_c3_g1_i1.p4  ORF type:complete len:110 (+),score=20.71 TRINITY_DN17653_c3_g1_i1:34-330(+)